MRSKRFIISALLIGLFFFASVGMVTAEEPVEITYWQYFYETRVEAMDELIDQFEEENPNITVNHETFPYDDYNLRVSSSVPVEKGPNVIQLYYGWLPRYIDGGFLQPLDHDKFAPKDIEEEFFPLVEASKVDNDYYALPTAVRSLALVYNKDIFEEAGLDRAPENLDELVEYAKATTKRDNAGNLLRPGMSVQIDSQLHHWLREILTRNFGGQPYSDDLREAQIDSSAGIDALTYLTDLDKEHEVGKYGFMTTDIDAFRAKQMAMTIIGSFTLGQFEDTEGLNYGVAEIPSHEGNEANFGSYWANGITSFTEDEELEASEKFLEFITSDEAMELWLEVVGELPAKSDAAEQYRDHELYGPFVKGLDYAHATFFIDEPQQRQMAIDAFEKVTLEDMDPAQAAEEWADEEQELLDAYYNEEIDWEDE